VVTGPASDGEGKIQSRYGYALDQIRHDVDDWYKSMHW